jgi:GAF domain-containing protein
MSRIETVTYRNVTIACCALMCEAVIGGGEFPEESTCSEAAAGRLALGAARHAAGREVVSIYAFDGDGPFTDLDETVSVHLGQTASAAIERALLHEGRPTRDQQDM